VEVTQIVSSYPKWLEPITFCRQHGLSLSLSNRYSRMAAIAMLFGPHRWASLSVLWSCSGAGRVCREVHDAHRGARSIAGLNLQAGVALQCRWFRCGHADTADRLLERRSSMLGLARPRAFSWLPEKRHALALMRLCSCGRQVTENLKAVSVSIRKFEKRSHEDSFFRHNSLWVCARAWNRAIALPTSDEGRCS